MKVVIHLIVLGVVAAVDVAQEANPLDAASCSVESLSPDLLEMGTSKGSKLGQKDTALLQLGAKNNKTRTDHMPQHEVENSDMRQSGPAASFAEMGAATRTQAASIDSDDGRRYTQTDSSRDQTQEEEFCKQCEHEPSLLQRNGDDPCERCRKMSRNLVGARIAPFGKEDTARELQHHAARTQDTLVDAIENAEVAEIKRSIFRSLTRLRAAEIKEFDTIARLETQAIDEYNDNHHYRAENPLDYIHAAEGHVKEDKYTSFHD